MEVIHTVSERVRAMHSKPLPSIWSNSDPSREARVLNALRYPRLEDLVRLALDVGVDDLVAGVDRLFADKIRRRRNISVRRQDVVLH